MVKRTTKCSKGSKVIAKYRDGGEVGGIAGGAGVGGSSMGGRGGNASVGGGSRGSGGGNVRGGGVTSGNKTGTTMSTPTPKTAMARPRPTSAPPPKAPIMAAKPKPVGMAPKPKATIQNPFHQGSLTKVGDFIQKSRGRYGSSTGAPGTANQQGKGDLGAGIEGFSKTASRMAKGGSVPGKKK